MESSSWNYEPQPASAERGSGESSERASLGRARSLPRPEFVWEHPVRCCVPLQIFALLKGAGAQPEAGRTCFWAFSRH